MGSKTISLDDEAYNRLKIEKKDKESFSDVVKRITKPTAKKSLLEFAGGWNLTEKENKQLNDTRKKLESDFDDMFR